MRSFSKRLVFTLVTISVDAQKNRQIINQKKTPPVPQIVGAKGVVVDEKLSLLRIQPSLFADTVQRMRVGRNVVITGLKEADGVTFYRVNALPNNVGWVQAEAIVTKARRWF
jgi:hypothetical protein